MKCIFQKQALMLLKFSKETLGLFCILFFSFVQKVPRTLLKFFFYKLLPLYIFVRRQHTSRISTGILFSLRNTSSFQTDNISNKQVLINYYKKRCDLFIHHIKYYKKKQVLQKPLKIHGSKNITHALSQKRPILLLGLHMGLFELLHQFPWSQHLFSLLNSTTKHSKNTPTVSVLTAPAFASNVTKYMSFLRTTQPKGVTTFVRKKIVHPKNIKHHLTTCLRDNNIFAYMGDQASNTQEYLTLWDSISVPVSTRLLQLFQKHNGIVLPIFTYEKNKMTHLFCHPPLSTSSNSKNDWQNELKLFLEECIQKDPYQWNWSYPGWKIVKHTPYSTGEKT